MYVSAFYFICMGTVYAVPTEARRGRWIPRAEVTGIVYVLEIEPGSFAKAASAPSLQPHYLFIYFLSLLWFKFTLHGLQ